MDWKVPCIIYFARKNLNDFYDLSGKEKTFILASSIGLMFFHVSNYSNACKWKEKENLFFTINLGWGEEFKNNMQYFG